MPELDDSEHEHILDNDSADAGVAKLAIETAIANGVSPADAEALYGSGRSADLDTEDLNRITGEVVDGRPAATPDDARQADFRQRLTANIKALRAEGIVPETLRE